MSELQSFVNDVRYFFGEEDNSFQVLEDVPQIFVLLAM